MLSKAFFSKDGQQYELDGLVAKQVIDYKVILSIWHGVDRNDVLSFSLNLAEKIALNSSDKSIVELVDELISVLKITD